MAMPGSEQGHIFCLPVFDIFLYTAPGGEIDMFTFSQKNLQNTGLPLRGLSLPS